MGDKYQQGIYDGRKLVDKQNVVLVNINYRPDRWGCKCLLFMVLIWKFPKMEGWGVPQIIHLSRIFHYSFLNHPEIKAYPPWIGNLHMGFRRG